MRYTFVCFMAFLPYAILGKSNCFVRVSTSGVFLSHDLQAHIQSNQRESYVLNNRQKSVSTFSSELGFGLQSIQGKIYVDGQLYFILNNLNRTLYHEKDDIVQDSVYYHQNYGVGVGGRFGFIASAHIIPFVSFGVEYSPHRLTYCAKNAENQDQIVVKHKSPFYAFGLGSLLNVSDSFAFSIEGQYKTAKAFDVLQLPSNVKGYPSLAGSRLRVSNNQWSIKIGLTYKLFSF